MQCIFMIGKKFAAALAMLVFGSCSCGAMDFRIQSQGRVPAVQADGPIVFGDADRLRLALAMVPRDNLGLKHMLLNSPGGSVDAAFQMVYVMDAIGVSTLVPPGASCASACASIVFVAGRTHVVAPGGRIGFHTCYKTDTRAEDLICNDRIASFGLDHGVAYGSLSIFMNAVPPDGILWFSIQEADCYGLNRWPEGMTPPGWNSCIADAIRNSQRQ
jgi:hypothetical protein